MEYRIVIKNNNCATNDPCAICGKRTDSVVGPELFLEGTWALVCEECGQKYAQSLLLTLETAREAWEISRRGLAARSHYYGQSPL
jgi:hypothetical protein